MYNITAKKKESGIEIEFYTLPMPKQGRIDKQTFYPENQNEIKRWQESKQIISVHESSEEELIFALFNCHLDEFDGAEMSEFMSGVNCESLKDRLELQDTCCKGGIIDFDCYDCDKNNQRHFILKPLDKGVREETHQMYPENFINWLHGMSDPNYTKRMFEKFKKENNF